MKSSSSRPHAVLIGRGLGGLAAAVRRGARGYRTTVGVLSSARVLDSLVPAVAP